MNRFKYQLYKDYLHVDDTKRNPQENVVVKPLSSYSMPIEHTSVNEAESSSRKLSPKNHTKSDEKDNRGNRMRRKNQKWRRKHNDKKILILKKHR